jgi:protein-S-isoprenylcysteine O-methyltransferase Ste14
MGAAEEQWMREQVARAVRPLREADERALQHRQGRSCRTALGAGLVLLGVVLVVVLLAAMAAGASAADDTGTTYTADSLVTAMVVVIALAVVILGIAAVIAHWRRP